MGKKLFLGLCLLTFLFPREASLGLAPAYLKLGIASWYSESDPGINLTTANGEVFDETQFTCATWEFPFQTWLRVTNLANQRSVVCRVNDRGPSKRLNRLIDLTKAGFEKIAPLRLGLISVKVEIENLLS